MPYGLVTPVSSGGGGTVLFDSTLSGAAASIDTGANGIAAGSHFISCFILARTTQAIVFSSVLVTLNNDSGAHYDLIRLQGANVTASSAPGLGTTSWTLDAPGANAGASYPSQARLDFVSYDKTTFFKMGTYTHAQVDPTAANTLVEVCALGFRSTAAISRMAVAAGSGNLVAGSRLLIMGF